jgi:hypothetical protein
MPNRALLAVVVVVVVGLSFGLGSRVGIEEIDFDESEMCISCIDEAEAANSDSASA